MHLDIAGVSAELPRITTLTLLLTRNTPRNSDSALDTGQEADNSPVAY